MSAGDGQEHRDERDEELERRDLGRPEQPDGVEHDDVREAGQNR